MAPLVRPTSGRPDTLARTTLRSGAPAPRGAVGEAPPVAGAALPVVRRSLAEMVRLWMWRYRSRRELKQLDTDQLLDVGIHPRVARREAAKPFWRA
ncbi:hypothetical protein GCM10007301_46830 [Azorhizobium oxalatiphilum]|uniref:YjiS-like domain-containing protein n=1 Tax=Azorhizobium oxalatiphilum TaxID=980631 RepID=A0A917CAJ8_9HYPH|nr:DUF1127 domain-containing protein [Azorhizobium oxalatiphilum]GGF81329.1 hypothetical protein GCM10007301_46830 [Azorhizobium oxalatiphilum]